LGKYESRIKKDVVNPFMLQYFFTTQSQKEKHLEFLIALLRKIRELTTDRGYIDKRELRQGLIDEAAKEAGIRTAYDRSKVTNDLLRLGVVIGGEVRDNKFYSLEINLAFNARYLALSSTGLEVLEKSDENEQLQSLAHSYANNYIVSGILSKYIDLYGSGVVRISRRNDTEIYERIVKPAIDVLEEASSKFLGKNPRLAEDLVAIAHMMKNNENMRKKFIRTVLLPISLLTSETAVKVTRAAVELNIDEIRKLVGGVKVDLKDIVNAYCRLIRSAGFTQVGRVGPEVPVKALANILNIDFDTLNNLIQELSKYERGIVYEIAVGLRKDDPNRYVIRVESDLIKKICKDFN